jgi:hypothetical protein
MPRRDKSTEYRLVVSVEFRRSHKCTEPIGACAQPFDSIQFRFPTEFRLYTAIYFLFRGLATVVRADFSRREASIGLPLSRPADYSMSFCKMRSA